ncbi:MAG: helix-turn-helix transcriptional regulator [Syntrophomonadaceae bacterium]|nr:helix-turn-helix transcriptional regulator [Syntrophomonadaceae bacterium]
MLIGERIKKLREAVKLTQEAFAERLKVTKGFISNLEKGRVLPSDQLIHLMSYEFSSSEYWLLSGEGEMFLSPKELIKAQIEKIGDQAYYDAYKSLLQESSLVVIENAYQYKGRQEPDLEKMLKFLEDLWAVGDDNLRAWARVQFSRAFPPDVEEEVLKKCAEKQGQESSA